MAKIYYQIAEQYISLEHHDLSLVRAALAKYQDFEQPEGYEPSELRLSIVADDQVVCPEGAELLEEAREATFHSCVYAVSGGYCLTISHRDSLVSGLVSADWSRLRLSADWADTSTAYLIDRLIMIVFTMVTLPLGYLKVHASVTELGGRALVFMGVSGTGKSTHSRLWREHIAGCMLLNDDEPIVRPLPDGSVRVYGCPWSGSTPCYRQAWAEVAAFVLLRQAPENRLERLSALQAFDALFSSCAFMTSQSANKMLVFDAVSRVLERVGVYRLDNRPELEAVKLSHSLL